MPILQNGSQSYELPCLIIYEVLSLEKKKKLSEI